MPKQKSTAKNILILIGYTDCQTKIIFGTELAYAVKNFRVQGEYIMTSIQRDSTKVPEGEDKVIIAGILCNGFMVDQQCRLLLQYGRCRIFSD